MEEVYDRKKYLEEIRELRRHDELGGGF